MQTQPGEKLEMIQDQSSLHPLGLHCQFSINGWQKKDNKRQSLIGETKLFEPDIRCQCPIGTAQYPLTHVVLKGDLILWGAMLVTPA